MSNKKKKLYNDKDKLTIEITNLQNRKKEVNEKLKKPEELDNFEYNDLLIEKETIDTNIKNKEKQLKEIQKSLVGTDQALSKCDLAWENLFMGNSWDDINIKAVKMKYTGKKLSERKEEKNSEEKELRETTKPIETTEIVEVSKFAQKYPRLSKFFNWCKKGLNKVGEFLKNEPLDSGENNSNTQEKKEEKVERDAFIEELRRHVENDKADKEAAYIEKHKAKVKTQEEAERD